MNQAYAPIIDELLKLKKKQHISFHMPGHKHGNFLDEKLVELIGLECFKADQTEIEGLDNLHLPVGIISQSQKLAAEAFGAKNSYFLVNGSTSGIQAMLMASFEPGDHIILPRNIHVSVIYGLIQLGLKPIFINPVFNEKYRIFEGITPQQVEEAIRANSKAKGILLVNPNYFGICIEIEHIIKVAHQYGKLVLVDEAHGAHLYFNEKLPINALKAGADLVTTSIHKTMGSLTQTAILHVGGENVNLAKLEVALQMFQTTSPSYPLMASIDGARRKMFFNGGQALDALMLQINAFREKIKPLDGCNFLVFEDLNINGQLEPTKLVLNFSEADYSANEIGTILREQYLIEYELILEDNIVFLAAVGNQENDFHQLADALEKILDSRIPNYSCLNKRSPNFNTNDYKFLIPRSEITPREAWFSPWEEVAIEESINRISAQWLAPYPPGIPILIPGEVITKETIKYLLDIVEMGIQIQGAADGTMKTLRVVQKNS
jgi:arginine decarboxylase